MEIRYMNQQNQIMIQEAKIINQNYSVNWLASVYHQDILVCVRSSWVTYDELKSLLQDHCDEMKYQGSDVYWQKVTKQTSLQILTSIIKPPVDVILLPVTQKEILIPADEKECVKLQKTIKGVIKCTKKRESPRFALKNITEDLRFINDSLPVKREEIVAEYVVDNLRYPVTAAMLGQTISVQIPKNATCQPCIARNMNSKYNLMISEE